MLRGIAKAVEDMIALNSKFEVILSASELSIDTGEKGSFIFKLDSNNETLQFQTPYSGIFDYKYNPVEKTWLSIQDNHDIRGLFTRDLIRYYRGCPKF